MGPTKTDASKSVLTAVSRWYPLSPKDYPSTSAAPCAGVGEVHLMLDMEQWRKAMPDTVWREIPGQLWYDSGAVQTFRLHVRAGCLEGSRIQKKSQKNKL